VLDGIGGGGVDNGIHVVEQRLHTRGLPMHEG
jgi:hypothetical protein